jgi:hypothetical protein
MGSSEIGKKYFPFPEKSPKRPFSPEGEKRRFGLFSGIKKWGQAWQLWHLIFSNAKVARTDPIFDPIFHRMMRASL